VRLTFTIPGPPVPKARARVVSRVDASGKRKTRGITPKRTEAYEKHVKLLAHYALAQHTAPWPLHLAARYGLVVRVYFFEHEGDWDNYGKIVSDACQGVLWANDRQIVDGRCIKTKVARGQERIEIEAWPIEVDSRANML
jgi:Holliday junction resolvase RusA-like endonuclease